MTDTLGADRVGIAIVLCAFLLIMGQSSALAQSDDETAANATSASRSVSVSSTAERLKQSDVTPGRYWRAGCLRGQCAGYLRYVAQVGPAAAAKHVEPRHGADKRPVLTPQLDGIAVVQLGRLVQFCMAFS